MRISFCLSLFICFTESFTIKTNFQKYRRLRVYESIQKEKKETNCVVFFTGGSNAISPSIYSDFFTSLNNKNISVYVPCFRYKHLSYLVRALNKKYKNVVMIGHSSGCTTLLNQCNKKAVEKIVLLDPVNTRFGNNKKFFTPFLKKLLFLHASKSYQITHDPYGLPFIPFFRLLQHYIIAPCLLESTEFYAKNYGHSDILNPFCSNIMHFTRITVGTKKRKIEQLRNYHNQLSDIICHFIENDKTHYPTYYPQTIWDA